MTSQVARRNRWVIDFGVGTPENEAMLYDAPYAYLCKVVKPQRDEMRTGDGVPWWLHQRPRPAMRSALSGIDRFVVTPLVAKHRLFQWAESPALPDHAVGAFARDDDYFFGVLHSRPHEVWSLAMGTQLESRPRYTHTTCFETFPFPEPSQQQSDQIADAAKDLHNQRQTWLNPSYVPAHKRADFTLTNLYNDYPRWLASLHDALDRALFNAYSWPENPQDLDDDTILERLLELNLSREPEKSG